MTDKLVVIKYWGPATKYENLFNLDKGQNVGQMLKKIHESKKIPIYTYHYSEDAYPNVVNLLGKQVKHINLFDLTLSDRKISKLRIEADQGNYNPNEIHNVGFGVSSDVFIKKYGLSDIVNSDQDFEKLCNYGAAIKNSGLIVFNYWGIDKNYEGYFCLKPPGVKHNNIQTNVARNLKKIKEKHDLSFISGNYRKDLYTQKIPLLTGGRKIRHINWVDMVHIVKENNIYWRNNSNFSNQLGRIYHKYITEGMQKPKVADELINLGFGRKDKIELIQRKDLWKKYGFNLLLESGIGDNTNINFELMCILGVDELKDIKILSPGRSIKDLKLDEWYNRYDAWYSDA